MSCPRFRLAISSFEILVKVIGSFSLALTAVKTTSLSCVTLVESVSVSCAKEKRVKKTENRLK